MDSGQLIVVNNLLGTFVTLVLVGVLTAKVSQAVKVPDIVMFLLAGILIGPSMLKLINTGGQSISNQLILTFGSALILFDGGMSLDLQILKNTWKTITLLSTVGVFVTAAVTGLAAFVILRLPLFTAFLLGAVIASTDPATLIPVFKQIQIKKRVSQTVLAESAFNDAIGAILTFSLLGVLSARAFLWKETIVIFLNMVLGGLLAGAVIGFVVAYLIAHHQIGIFGRYSAVMILVAVLYSYLIAARIGGSGYMAVFVSGIILGNMPSFRLEHHDEYAREQHYFMSNAALIMRMLIFILLGTWVNFTIIGRYWLDGIVIVALFIVVARPLAVLVSTVPDRGARWGKNEILFMFWVRETGVIPAALAGLLISMGVADANVIASIAFMAILVTILLQASTTRLVAQKLGLVIKGTSKSGENKLNQPATG